VRKLAILVAALLVATLAQGAAVVLKGGKRLAAASFQQQGNLLVVRYADGRIESYPLVAVDMEATRVANTAPAAAAPEVEPEGPHSPFFGAQASAGTARMVLTDEDVLHIRAPEEGEGEGGEAKAEEPAGQVIITGYTKKRLEDGSCEIVATVLNRSKDPVSGVTVDMRLLNADGDQVGSGTGGFQGTLAAGEQGLITTRVPASGDPFQIDFVLRWQTVRPAAAAKPAAKAEAPPPATPPPTPGFTVPAEAPPTTLPSNPTALPPGNEAPAGLQTPPSPPPSQETSVTRHSAIGGQASI
jgi:hypothetical protein